MVGDLLGRAGGWHCRQAYDEVYSDNAHRQYIRRADWLVVADYGVTVCRIKVILRAVVYKVANMTRLTVD